MRNPFKTFIQDQPVVEEEKPRPGDNEAIGADSKETALATDRSPSSDGGDDDSIDKDAQQGVQNMEAITKTWTKRDLYAAYILWVNQFAQTRLCSRLTVTQNLVHLLYRRYTTGNGIHSNPICHQLFQRALFDGHDRRCSQHHWRYFEASNRQNHRYLGSTSRIPLDDVFHGPRPCPHGGLQQCQYICRSTNLLLGWVWIPLNAIFFFLEEEKTMTTNNSFLQV